MKPRAHWHVSTERANGADDLDGATHFVLWPHRALGRTGLVRMVLSVGAIMLLIAAVPGMAGHWPVSLAVVASYTFFAVAFLHNGRAPQFAEVIDILPRKLVVRTQGRSGEQGPQAVFDPYWARVDVRTDHYVENRLRLCQSDRTVEIGRFLAPEERADLARALSAAIEKARTDRGALDG